MKLRIRDLILPLLALLILGACNVSGNEEVMSEIDQAIEGNLTLDNAAFEKVLSTHPEGLHQEAEGVFISLGDDKYNWSHKEYLGSEANFQHIVEVDGMQQELLGVNEPNFEPEWQNVEGTTYELSNRIRPLLENTVEEEYIEEVKTNNEDGTQYIINLSDEYTENLMSEAVNDLENSILEFEENQGTTDYIQALETQIAMIESRAYNDPKIEIEINSEGYLTRFVESYSFTEEGSEPVTVVSEFILTDYNLENPEEHFPEI